MITQVPGVITIPIDPVLQLGPLPVHWYGVGYAVAFFVGYRVAFPHLRRHGFTSDDGNELLFWTILFGLIGARLYFVVQQPDLGAYLAQPLRILEVWNGGMAFFGAVIVAPISLAVVAWRRGLPLWVIYDAGVIFAGLGQAIGRIGNIINGDILGPPSDAPWAMAYKNNNFGHIAGVGYQPAALFEMGGSLVIFALVMLLLRRRPPAGTAFLLYLLAYPVSQFILFYLRSTEPVVAFGLKQAQLTSLVMLVLVLPAAWVARRRWRDVFGPDPVGAPEPSPSSPALAGEAGS